MRSATRVVVSTFGALVGVAGIEHGIGEVLQGDAAPAGMVIQSWPASPAFASVNGEPAMTVIPDLLVTGILAILASLCFIGWATLFADRKHGGLVLFLLCIAMLLVGGGFGPPILGTILAGVATRINAPLNGWRAHLPAGTRRFLAALWPWAFGAGLIDWLLMFPGLAILGHYFGVNDANLVLLLLCGMFGFLGLTIITALVHDIERESRAPLGPASTTQARTSVA